MTAAVDLFSPALHVARARIGLQEALGALLSDLPSQSMVATAIREAWQQAVGTSSTIHVAICNAEGQTASNVIPFGRRPRKVAR